MRYGQVARSSTAKKIANLRRDEAHQPRSVTVRVDHYPPIGRSVTALAAKGLVTSQLPEGDRRTTGRHGDLSMLSQGGWL
jgi:hypothetical protein